MAVAVAAATFSLVKDDNGIGAVTDTGSAMGAKTGTAIGTVELAASTLKPCCAPPVQRGVSTSPGLPCP